MNIKNIFQNSPNGHKLGLRERAIYKNSGEEFRDDHLIPWLEKNKNSEKLIIQMDGIDGGYPPSFLEEAFGGAIRKHGREMADLIDKIEFQYNDYPHKIEVIKRFVQIAKEALTKK